MSTPAGKTNSAPKWKQEVNQRVAAHKNRKGEAPAAAAPHTVARQASSKAAQAAARVAARYAQAPSYSQMLAEEARAAVRAAAAASQAALEAQAAAESVLAGLEAATGDGPAWDPAFSLEPEPAPATEPVPHAPVFFDPFFTQERPAPLSSRTSIERQGIERQGIERQTTSRPIVNGQPVEIRWDPDLPVRPAEPRAARAPSQPEPAAQALDAWGRPAPLQPETIEPARPIHANLIEFPRELVAARRARPRIAEGRQEQAHTGQLSIFEVDPGAISIEPAEHDTSSEPGVADWAGIRLDASPEFERQPEPASAQTAAWFPVAPVGFRLMAALVDGALIAVAFLLAALLTAFGIHHAVPVKSIELAGVAMLFVIGVLYQAVFFSFSEATPGMRYAGISLCTFDEQKPTREQMRLRVGALALSVLPIGLGVLWAIFDEGHLSWHDRLTGTYQRKG